MNMVGGLYQISVVIFTLLLVIIIIDKLIFIEIVGYSYGHARDTRT